MIIEIEVVDVLVDIYTLHINSIWEIYIWNKNRSSFAMEFTVPEKQKGHFFARIFDLYSTNHHQWLWQRERETEWKKTGEA